MHYFIIYLQLLPLKFCNINYLNECVCFAIVISYNIFVSSYHFTGHLVRLVLSLRMDYTTVETLTKKGAFLAIILRDINTKHYKWWYGKEWLNNLLSQYSQKQILNQLTFKTLINLVVICFFTDESNLLNDSGIHPSL